MKFRKSRFPVRRLADGRAMLNLGSSAEVAPGWNNVDFSWLLRLSRYRRCCAVLHRFGFLSEHRYQRILKLDPHMVLWNLAKGIPFAEQSFDVVYHSHLLEHLPREAAPDFLRECRRVLKPGGILRVVVPDLEELARTYIDVVNRLPDRATMPEHAAAVVEMFDQMVVRTPKVRKEQKLVVRLVEHILIGNTAREGSLHRWMYDRFSLEGLMEDAGFINIQVQEGNTSQIAGWSQFHLDTKLDGSLYAKDSLYMEGNRS